MTPLLPLRIRTRRNGALPAQRRDSGEGAPDSDAGPPSAPAGTVPLPSRRRVRMLVEVVDHADEVALVTQLCEERGWSVRSARTDTAHRTALTVEVRLNGARRGAVRAAVRQVEQLAAQAELGAWVRDAALVQRERTRGRTTYHLHVKPPATTAVGRLTALLWTRLGLADEHRLISVPAGTTEDEVRTELGSRDLGGATFDAARHAVRVPHYSDPTPPSSLPDQERRIRLAWTVAGGAGLVLALLCGLYVAWLPGRWKLLPALLGLAGGLPLGHVFKETRDRSLSVKLVAGLTVTLCATGFGALAGTTFAQRIWWEIVVLLVLAGYTVTGLVVALRGTFVARHAVWLIPLTVPVLGTFVAWLGEQLRTAYLDEFGIGQDSVPSSSLWTYVAVAEPLTFVLFFVALIAATAGWLRHFHLTKGDYGRPTLLMLGAVALLFATQGVKYGVDKATSAAARAQSAAARGRTPGAYFGLHGTLVCVRPVARPIPVDNGPVVTGHPVLSFGAAGDWIELWDPARPGDAGHRSFAVRREDVQLFPARNPASGRCPAG